MRRTARRAAAVAPRVVNNLADATSQTARSRVCPTRIRACRTGCLAVEGDRRDRPPDRAAFQVDAAVFHSDHRADVAAFYVLDDHAEFHRVLGRARLAPSLDEYVGSVAIKHPTILVRLAVKHGNGAPGFHDCDTPQSVMPRCRFVATD